MGDDLAARLAALTAEERGLIAGLQLLGSAAAPLGACADTLAALQEMPRERRAEVLAGLLAEVATPWPADLDALDPSWVEVLVDEHPVGLIRAVLASAPVPWRAAGEAALRGRDGPAWEPEPAARADLVRLVTAPLAALLVPASGPLGAALAARPRGELEAELCGRGARVLGRSLAGAPPEVLARAMARAGAPWSAEIAAAGAARADATDQNDRDEHEDGGSPDREQAQAMVARAAAATGLDPIERLQAVGALALAGALEAEGGGSLARVAGRLPVRLGLLVLQREDRANNSASRVL